MDLRSYFESSAKPSTKVLPSNPSSSEEESDVPQAKRRCVSTSKPELSNKHQRTGNSRRKYQERWEKEFTWLEYDADSEGAFCKLCKTSGKPLSEQEECGQPDCSLIEEKPAPTARVEDC